MTYCSSLMRFILCTLQAPLSQPLLRPLRQLPANLRLVQRPNDSGLRSPSTLVARVLSLWQETAGPNASPGQRTSTAYGRMAHSYEKAEGAVAYLEHLSPGQALVRREELCTVRWDLSS